MRSKKQLLRKRTKRKSKRRGRAKLKRKMYLLSISVKDQIACVTLTKYQSVLRKRTATQDRQKVKTLVFRKEKKFTAMNLLILLISE